MTLTCVDGYIYQSFVDCEFQNLSVIHFGVSLTILGR